MSCKPTVDDQPANFMLARRSLLGAAIGAAVLPPISAAKPPLVLALDTTALFYLEGLNAQLVTRNSLVELNGAASRGRFNAVVVVMDLAWPESEKLLKQIAACTKVRDIKVYGVGLAPFSFEGLLRIVQAKAAWLELQQHTDMCKLIRSDEAAELLGCNVTCDEAERYLLGTIQNVSMTFIDNGKICFQVINQEGLTCQKTTKMFLN